MSKHKARASKHKLIDYPVPMGIACKPIPEPPPEIRDQMKLSTGARGNHEQKGKQNWFAFIREKLIDRSMPRVRADPKAIRDRIAYLKELATVALKSRGRDPKKFAEVIYDAQSAEEITDRLSYAAARCLERLDDVESEQARFEAREYVIVDLDDDAKARREGFIHAWGPWHNYWRENWCEPTTEDPKMYFPMVRDHPARQSGLNMLFYALAAISDFHALTVEEFEGGIAHQVHSEASRPDAAKTLREKRSPEHARWKREAEEVRKSSPRLSKTAVAAKVKQKLKLTVTTDYIRKRI
jgi:hypothetical protein